jgi:hypothetical protein
MEHGMTIDLWRALIGAVIGMVTFAIFARLAAGRPSDVNTAQMQGVLAISPVYAGGSVIVMGGLGLLMLGPWIVSASPLPTYLGVICIALAALSPIALLPVFQTSWDAQGITTPASFCGMPWPGTRRFFAWGGLATAGGDLMGNQFVKDAAGRTLRWNFSYRGHRALMRAVPAYRPDLFK